MNALVLGTQGPLLAVRYLQEEHLHITLHNTGAVPVIVQTLAGHLWFPPPNPNVPPDRFPFPVTLTDRWLEPGAHCTAVGRISPRLIISRGTNYIDLEATYQEHRDGRYQSVTTSSMPHQSCCVIVADREETTSRVFISHKIPEDTDLARELQDLLKRAGIQAYVVEDDPRFDVDLWKDKIPDAIRRSEFTVVLWTAHALASLTEGVQREVDLSRQRGVPVALLKDPSIPLPRGFDGNHEWLPLEARTPYPSLVRAAETIYRQIQR